MNTNFIQFDRAASYIPGVSTIVNLPEIIYKIFIMNEVDENSFLSNTVKCYLSEKSLVRCIVSLIPILGNLALIASDLIELARGGQNVVPTTDTFNPIVLSEEIHQSIEKRERIEAEFEEIIPLVRESLKNEGSLFASKLEESTNAISKITDSVNTITDQGDLVTKKIIAFRGEEDDYLGKIIDTLALGAIVYMGSGLTVMGLCGSAITLKVWSFFRGASS